MKVEDVEGMVSKLFEHYLGRGKGDWDDESAHAAEDDIHQAVLAAIAAGICEDPAGCAKAALKTLEQEFHRWCA